MSEKPEVGSIVEGKVVRIKPFGAIVSLGEKIIYYGIIFLVAMVLGCLLKGKKKEEIS